MARVLWPLGLGSSTHFKPGPMHPVRLQEGGDLGLHGLVSGGVHLKLCRQLRRLGSESLYVHQVLCHCIVQDGDAILLGSALDALYDALAQEVARSRMF